MIRRINQSLFRYQLQDNRTGRQENIGSKTHWVAKAHQSILQHPMAGEYRHIQRTDQNTPGINYPKSLMSSKEKHDWAILADFSPCWCKVDRTRFILMKIFQDQPIRSQTSCWNPIANVFVTLQYERFQLKTWLTHWWKKLIAINDAPKFTKKTE